MNGVSVCVRENKTAPLTESLLSLATSFGMIFAGNGKVDKSNSSIYKFIFRFCTKATKLELFFWPVPLSAFQSVSLISSSPEQTKSTKRYHAENRIPKKHRFHEPLEKIKRSRWRGYRHMQIPTWTPQGQLLASRCATGNVWSLGRAADVLKRLEDIDDIGGDVGGSLFDLSEFQIKGLPQCDPTIHATVINVNMCIYII